MKRIMNYFFVMSIFIFSLAMRAASLEEIQTEVISSKRGLEEMRNTLTNLSSDSKKDLATFCGNFCARLDDLEQRYNQLSVDIQNFFKSIKGKPKKDQSALSVSKANEMSPLVAELKDERQSLIAAYNQLLAEKIPHLHER